MLTLDTVFLFLWIVITHWVADFIFQSDKWANTKSSSFKSLIKHTITYSIIMSVLWYPIFLGDFEKLYLFFILTLITHTITDFFTSKIVKKKFDKKEYGSSIPNFGAFTVIGFDQVIHYTTIIFTLYFLGKV